MKKASWIVLTVVGVLILLGSVASAVIAHGSTDYNIGPAATVSDVAAGRPEVLTALRGMRGTAAAYAAAYGVLFLVIVLGPYRRGDLWAWWALFAGGLTVMAFALVRIPFLGTALGVQAPGIQFAVIVVGLLLDVGRLKSPSR